MDKVKSYVMDAMALRRASQRHRRLGWHDSANYMWREAKSRMGYARMWADAKKNTVGDVKW